jgi:hypothetical protein
MKLPAVHQPADDIARLQARALRRDMGGQMRARRSRCSGGAYSEQFGFEIGAHALQATTPQNLIPADDDDRSDDGSWETIAVARCWSRRTSAYGLNPSVCFERRPWRLQDLDLG